MAAEAAHAVTLFGWHSALGSNVIQLLVPLLSACACMYRERQNGASRQAQPWFLLTFAFALWAFAQGLYTLAHFSSRYFTLGPASDALWLVFPFPLLLVASRFSSASRHDAVSWLDILQASLFFATLFVLAYGHPAIMSLPFAYSVQSIALLLACALRYSMTASGQEREFHRKLAWFAGLYALFSNLGYLGQEHGLDTGTPIDLCWTAPFSIFSVLALLPDRTAPPRPVTRFLRLSDPIHLQGISAHCLAAMSFAAAAMLAYHKPLPGGTALLCAFLLSAGRTSARDWQNHMFQARLEETALHDALTGLPNRSCLRLELTRRLERAPGQLPGYAVFFVNLDHFQRVNDGLGFASGNVLIRQIALLLTDLLRPGDVLGRTGGDEFAVLFDSVDARQALVLAEAMLARLRQPMEVEGRTLTVTASAGLASATGSLSADLLLQSANCAMYAAKRLGRDQVQCFVPAMLEMSRNRQQLYTDLRATVNAGQIEVHYQPIYSLKENAITGFEALARWHHPEHGQVSPSDFIPLAEESGLIVSLGRQVLRKACWQCAEWNRRFGSALTVSVNVSARQFEQPELFHNVITALKDAGLNPELLRLEITETVLLSASENIKILIGQLRVLGIGISLDDFGTGYSSLGYMLHLPFDIMKIDQSFVRSLHLDSRRAQIVASIIDLAAKLQMKIIAEGVELPEELARLREFHCDMVQGYLLSRPLAPPAMQSLLEGCHIATNLDKAVWRLLSDPCLIEKDQSAPMQNLSLPTPFGRGVVVAGEMLTIPLAKATHSMQGRSSR